MNIVLVPSSVGGDSDERNQHATTYLVNETVAIDAGCLGFYRGPAEQARIQHVFLSHTHIDHVATLPIFVENAYEGRAQSVVIHGSIPVLDSLQRDIFNDRLWPDFIGLSHGNAPFLRLEPLVPGKAVTAEGLRITPVEVDHIVPTVGFLIEERGRTVVISSDTGPTEEIWRRARAAKDLRALFVEVTFPNAMTWLAEASKHLTPAMFAVELAKIGRPVDTFAVHLKPRFRHEVVAELQALGLPQIQFGKFGVPYHF